MEVKTARIHPFRGSRGRFVKERMDRRWMFATLFALLSVAQGLPRCQSGAGDTGRGGLASTRHARPPRTHCFQASLGL